MRFVLMCQVLDGESPVQIRWFKDNQELGPAGLQVGQQVEPERQPRTDDQVELLANDELSASLLFRRVHQQHSGNYTCLATNHFGSTSYSSFISVKGESITRFLLCFVRERADDCRADLS